MALERFSALGLLILLTGCATAREGNRAIARPRVLEIATEQLGCDAVRLAWLEPGEPIRPGVSSEATNAAEAVPSSDENYASLSGCGDTSLVVRCEAREPPRCDVVTQRMALNDE